MEIFLGDIEKHLKNKGIIRHSQNQFFKEKSCLSNLMSFYDKVTHLVGEGKEVNIIFLDSSKAFEKSFWTKFFHCEIKRFMLC